MNNWTDTHAHLYSKQFDDDRDAVVDRFRQAGVQRLYMPNIDMESIDRMLDAEQKYPECLAMMGLHPCHVDSGFEETLKIMEAWLERRRFVAIGEIGTDLYWDKTFWPQQQEAFLTQVEWSLKYQLPIVIHCRSSMDETLNLLEPYRGKGLRGVFHCFSGSAEQLAKVVDCGFHVGIGGVSTYKNGGLETVLPGMNLDRLLLETDCPYLAPVPHRGKRNEPSFLPFVAARVSEILRVDLADLALKTTSNAQALFGPTP